MTPTPEAASNDWPTGQGPQNEFYRHMVDDLMPFWENKGAFGFDGHSQWDFPTWRCNDGTPYIYYGKRDSTRNFENCRELDAHNPDPKDRDWKVEDLANIDGWLKVPLQRGANEYVRTRSRRVFGYCVAFNMTGDKKHLEYCRESAKFLMQNAFHKEGDGSITSKGVLDKDAEGNELFIKLRQSKNPLERQNFYNPQDQAYALQGIAMYYQVTRDPEALTLMLDLQKSIFDKFYDSSSKTMYQYLKNDDWTKQPTVPIQLVDHLDQMNAYMLLGAKAILNFPSNGVAMAAAKEWQGHLLDLSEKIFSTFYRTFVESGQIISYEFTSNPSEEIHSREAIPPGRQTLNLFLGNSLATQLGPQTLTDFGHSIKTFWMINMIGKLVNHDERTNDVDRARARRLLKITKDRAEILLGEAWNKDNQNTWCDGYKPASWTSSDPAMRYDCNKTWWMHDELNQVSMHFDLEDCAPRRTQAFVRLAFDFYTRTLVDRANHGVYHQYNTENLTPPNNPQGPVGFDQVNPWYPKAHHWKSSAYHESEHAIVGYIVSESLRSNSVTLYYAYHAEPEAYPYAYFYRAKADKPPQVSNPDQNGITKVVFTGGVE